MSVKEKLISKKAFVVTEGIIALSVIAQFEEPSLLIAVMIMVITVIYMAIQGLIDWRKIG